jgi:glucokinase
MRDRIVAIDVGGTRVRVAVGQADGHIITQTARPTLASQGHERVVDRIVETVRDSVDDWSRVQGIGLAAPGTLDVRKGLILEAPNLPGMMDYPMQARLQAEFPVPAFIGNDANLAALAEHRFGAGRGVDHMVYVTISTGIGGGIIADGKLFLGWRGFAGEVGHQTLEAHGPMCNCGNIGCLEVLAAGPAIARKAREALRAGRASMLRSMVDGDLDKLSTAMVTQAAKAGDPLARELFEDAGYYIGLGIVNLVHILDTELFVLGGGVAINAWELIYPSMLATLDRNAMPSMRKGVRIVQAQLGDDVGLIGTLAYVADRLKETEPRAQRTDEPN